MFFKNEKLKNSHHTLPCRLGLGHTGYLKLPFHLTFVFTGHTGRFIHESKISESEIYFFVALFEECATKF